MPSVDYQTDGNKSFENEQRNVHLWLWRRHLAARMLLEPWGMWYLAWAVVFPECPKGLHQRSVVHVIGSPTDLQKWIWTHGSVMIHPRNSILGPSTRECDFWLSASSQFTGSTKPINNIFSSSNETNAEDLENIRLFMMDYNEWLPVVRKNAVWFSLFKFFRRPHYNSNCSVFDHGEIHLYFNLRLCGMILVIATLFRAKRSI